MVVHLLERRLSTEKNEQGEKLDLMLTAAAWAVLKRIPPILEPFRTAQKLLEDGKYVTGSLVVPCMFHLLNELNDAISELQGSSDYDDDADLNAARAAAVMPRVTALRKDFINQWGEEAELPNYTEGIRRQPGGFKLVQVLATALHPRAKFLNGIDDDVRPMVWNLVQDEAVKIAGARRHEPKRRGSYVAALVTGRGGSTAGRGGWL